MLLRITWLAVACLIFSCVSRDGEEFVKWVRDYDNGLHVKQNSGEFLLDLQYQPGKYLKIIQGIEHQTDTLHDGIQHYLLTIDLQSDNQNIVEYNCHTPEDMQRKLYYFSYLFQNDITLEENGNILPCVLFHFERSADLKKSRTFLLGFENHDKESEEARLVINSQHLGSLPIKIKVLKN